MQGYSPKLPLRYDPTLDGLYATNKTLIETIRQNLLMLINTSPGERIMDPFFGVRLQSYLFEPYTEQTIQQIKSRILAQVSKYMSYVQIDEINFSTNINNESSNENMLYINIIYTIPVLSSKQQLIVKY